jgi:hypothetical protein
VASHPTVPFGGVVIGARIEPTSASKPDPPGSVDYRLAAQLQGVSFITSQVLRRRRRRSLSFLLLFSFCELL